MMFFFLLFLPSKKMLKAEDPTPSERIHSLRQFERLKRSRHLVETQAIVFGKEEPLTEEARFVPYDHFLCYASTFCYHCDAANHSQHFCPLKQCTTCYKFGHSFRACQPPVLPPLPPSWAPKSKFFRSFRASSKFIDYRH